jgi:hypothetical protein
MLSEGMEQGCRVDQRRLSRDTYLGAAAAALAVSYFFAFSGLLKTAGFVLFSVAFLGRASGRAKALRLAGFVLAGTFVVTFLLNGVSIGVSLFFSLVTIVVVLLAAWAFASGRDGGRRDPRLGWAAVVAAVGGLALLLYEIFTMPVFDADGHARWAMELGHFLFLALAGGTAAAAFFARITTSERPAYRRVARRDGYLALAAIWLSLSYACQLAAWVIPAQGGWGDLAHSPAPLLLLSIPTGLARVAAGVLAVIGFSLSCRSLRDRSERLDFDSVQP